MTVAVGDLRPQPTPCTSPVVVAWAAAVKSSQLQVSPVGISTPAASSRSVFANTMYDCRSVGAAMIWPSTVTVSQTPSDTPLMTSSER